MKTTLGHVILALALLGAGALVRSAATVERQLAGAETRLATLQPDVADAEYAQVMDMLWRRTFKDREGKNWRRIYKVHYW